MYWDSDTIVLEDALDCVVGVGATGCLDIPEAEALSDQICALSTVGCVALMTDLASSDPNDLLQLFRTLEFLRGQKIFTVIPFENANLLLSGLRRYVTGCTAGIEYQLASEALAKLTCSTKI